jgi:hypothetical protein
VSDPETKTTPYVVTAMPGRDATDDEVDAWARGFAQRMVDAADEVEREQ